MQSEAGSQAPFPPGSVEAMVWNVEMMDSEGRMVQLRRYWASPQYANTMRDLRAAGRASSKKWNAGLRPWLPGWNE